MSAIPSVASFRRALAGTPMAAEAGSIYAAAMAGGINPALVAGIAGAESNFGKSGYAVGKNNPFGLMGFTFPNYTAATKKLTQTLNGSNGYKKAYASGGLNAMIQIYTPRGAANGPDNDPDGHTNNIINIGRRTGGDASQAYVKAGQTVAGGTAAMPNGGNIVTTAAMNGYGLGPKVLEQIMAYMNSGRKSIAKGEDVLTPQGHMDAMASILSMVPTADTLGGAAGIPAASGSPVASSPYTGDSIAGPNYSGGPGSAPMNRGDFAYPLLRKGTFGGGPGGGSHSFTSGPNNWQSDNAIDLMTPVGTPVYAVQAGTVGSNFGPLNSRDPRMAGSRMTVSNPHLQAYYAHLSNFAPGIKPGVAVKRGQLLGYSGSANGAAHLHLGFSSGNPSILK